MARPEVYQRIHEEARSLLGDGGTASPTALDRLPWARQVSQEALRLFPPGYAFSGRAVQDVDLDGLAVPAGADVLVSPFLLHRRAPDCSLPFGSGTAPASARSRRWCPGR